MPKTKPCPEPDCGALMDLVEYAPVGPAFRAWCCPRCGWEEDVDE